MSAALPAFAQAAVPSVLGGLLGSGKTTKRKDRTPKFQRQLIDQILSGLQGEGPFADLFQADEEGFKRSVSDPLQQVFRTQTAPGIQQRFISQGQQRGTPLESALSRAGLDVQSNINQLFLPFQQAAQSRKQQAINQLLGFTPTIERQLTPLGGALAGIASPAGSQALGKGVESLFTRAGFSS